MIPVTLVNGPASRKPASGKEPGIRMALHYGMDNLGVE